MNVDFTLRHIVTPHILRTLFVAIAISLVCIVIYQLYKKRFETNKQKIKFRSRLTYIALSVFLVAIIQIWLEGLTQIFTMLGLVAAGLVVSNKETIMNFVGFLIVNWRGIFTEGDFIQIQNHVGYVQSIHPLYFKLYETTSLDQQQATGKSIKVPNSLIITNPTITISPETDIVLSQLKFTVDMNANIDIQQLLGSTEKIISDLLNKHYNDKPNFNPGHLKKNKKPIAVLMSASPKVYAKVLANNSKGLTICVDFYCYPSTNTEIETEFWQAIKVLFSQNQINFVF